MLIALDFLLGPSQEVVVAGEPNQPGTIQILRQLRGGFAPRRVLLLRERGERGQRLAALAPYVSPMEPSASGVMVYLCEGNTCKAPVSSPEDLASLLGPAS